MRIKAPSTNRPRYKMKDIVEFLEQNGDEICFNPLSGRQSTFQCLEKYFTEETLENLTKPTIITRYDIDLEQLFLFRNYIDEKDPTTTDRR